MQWQSDASVMIRKEFVNMYITSFIIKSMRVIGSNRRKAKLMHAQTHTRRSQRSTSYSLVLGLWVNL